MTLTIDGINIVNKVESVLNVPLGLSFREERYTASGALKIKQRINSNKLIKRIDLAFLTEAEFASVNSKLNAGFFTCSLSGAGSHNFSGSYTVSLDSYSDSFNGTKKSVNLIFKPE